MSINRNSLLAIAGIASFLLFVIARIPAGLIINPIGESLAGLVQFGGIEGTVWSGSVRSIDMNGWQLRNTSWDMNPAALLLGRMSTHFATRIAGSELTTDASVSVTGTISIRDLETTGPIVPIAANFNLPATGGRYQIRLSALNISDAWPTRLIGSVQVIDVPVTVVGDATGPTGNYTIVFNAESVPDDGQLTGALTDDGGPVEITGNIVLTPPNNYTLQAKLKARPGAPVEITQALNFAGPVDPDGHHEFSMTGSL